MWAVLLSASVPVALLDCYLLPFRKSASYFQLAYNQKQSSQILRTYGNSIDRLRSDIQMEAMVDVLWVLSCRTMDGMVKIIPKPLANYWAH